MAPLCKFYQQGNCRNGMNCRFEHPGATNNPFGNNVSNSNRFGALSSGGGKPQDGSNPYKITKEGIQTDLAHERPTWILSCYGPGRDAPEQLFGGYPREQSLEEVMVHIRGSPNQQQAMSEVTALYSQAEQQIQTTLGHLDGAVQYLMAAGNNHPNRNDICRDSSAGGGLPGAFSRDTAPAQNSFLPNPLASNSNANPNPFSSNTGPSPSPFGGGGTSAFGQPSALGQKPNPFGSAPTTSTFGQPSQIGASSAPAFGQPSQVGSSGPAFGQTSQLGAGGPAFGQASNLGPKPSPFAAAASGPSGFAQAAQNTQSAFGQPSTIGQRPNPFGTANSSSPSPFAQAAPTTSASPFGQPAPAASSSPFAQPAASNPFATAAKNAGDQDMDTAAAPVPAANNPFGQQQPSAGFGAQTNSTPFGGQSSGFGAGAAAGAVNPFGQPQAQAPAAAPANAGAPKSGPYPPGSSKQHPPLESYVNKGMNGRVMSFNGQPVVYKWKFNDKYQDARPPNPDYRDPPVPGYHKPDGAWAKIFFADGPPPYNKDTEPDPAQYTDAVRAQYQNMAATGRFEGDMPEVPPMREDCIWTF